MNHIIEPAASGRAKCRGCGRKIEKGELRLGEQLPNPFAEGYMTLWYHLPCGAFKRPDVLLEALGTTGEQVEDVDRLREMASPGIEHRRLPRVDTVQRAPTARATCRHCREIIQKNEWRIGLVFYEEGRFNPAGYVHLACTREYIGTVQIVDRLVHFTPDLPDEDVREIRSVLGS